MRLALALCVLLLAATPAASSASAPVVPAPIQSLAKARAGTLAYAPTRVPFRYRYTAYRWNAESRQLSFRFDDARFARNGKHRLWFTAERFGGTLAGCAEGKQTSYQLDGNKVYADAAVAWRCVRGADGRLVKLLASGPNLPAVALGQVVASGKRLG